MQWIKRAWRGEEKLWVVFWAYDVIVFLIVKECIRTYAESSISNEGRLPIIVIFAIAFLIYFIWLNVSLWRCAFNAQRKEWGYLVRFIIIIQIGSILIGVPLMLKGYQCTQIMIEQGSKLGVDPRKYINAHMDELNKCVDEHRW